MEIISLDKEIDFGFRPAISVGMFDGVHIGHQKLLNILKEKANKLGTKPIIITFDKHPRLVLTEQWGENAIKLLQTSEERFEKLASLGFEKIITIPFTEEFAKKSATEFLELIIDNYSIQYILLGYDNNFGNKSPDEFENIQKKAKEKGVLIERTNECEYYQDIKVSSTQIRKALEKGDISLAKKMLGGDYIFNGRVIKGNQIGRKIGFPTANVEIDQNKLLPRFGVYTVRVNIDGVFYNGVLNIGIRPTIENSPIVLEVFIIDYSQDLYNKTIRIHFVDFMRPEKKFDSLEELRKHIALDVELAKKMLG